MILLKSSLKTMSDLYLLPTLPTLLLQDRQRGAFGVLPTCLPALVRSSEFVLYDFNDHYFLPSMFYLPMLRPSQQPYDMNDLDHHLKQRDYPTSRPNAKSRQLRPASGFFLSTASSIAGHAVTHKVASFLTTPCLCKLK